MSLVFGAATRWAGGRSGIRSAAIEVPRLDRVDVVQRMLTNLAPGGDVKKEHWLKISRQSARWGVLHPGLIRVNRDPYDVDPDGSQDG